MLFVDRRVGWLLSLERQTENRLARRPHDPAQADEPRCLEDVVRAQNVRSKGGLLGVNSGCGNRREVNDGIRPVQRFDRLAEVGQVGEPRRRGGFGLRDDVDRMHVVLLLE
jgi:hypothetical protein